MSACRITHTYIDTHTRVRTPAHTFSFDTNRVSQRLAERLAKNFFSDPTQVTSPAPRLAVSLSLLLTLSLGPVSR
jgi:hypothetical protein